MILAVLRQGLSLSGKLEKLGLDKKMEDKPQDFVISQIQLILAEKRTSLSVLRTGIAVFTLPLSVFTILIATSRYYSIFDILALFISLLGICVGLVILGIYLILKSSRNIRHFDIMIKKLKEKNGVLRQMVE
jgi:positive regulator of sigma E activity